MPATGPRESAIARVPLVFAALALLAHLPALASYGWFRDELYYVACSRHLAWGYVDQPPLSIALLAVWRFLFGGGLATMRVAPALAHGGLVLVVGLLARALGGGRFAQALACLAALLAPGLIGTCHIYSMNAFDLLAWALATLALVRALERDAPGPWLALGIATGLGLLNKISMLWFGAALGAGLLLTPHRRALARPWPWLAGALALALFVPHLAWQVQNGWPTLEFMHNATTRKMVTSPASVLLGQLLETGPGNVPVWLAGLGWLLASPRWRILGLMWLGVLAILLAAPASRASYLLVAYPALFAAGGVALERASGERAWLGRARPAVRRAWGALRPALLALVAISGLALLPMAVPVLPVATYIAYARALGVAPRGEERTRPAELPQHYADMFGWEEMAARVGRVYQALPPQDRARCGIYAQNYGEAGALDLFGPRYGLPPALSGHNNYFLWGPRGYTGEVMIELGGRREDLEREFASVTLADSITCEHCMPYERGRHVWVCRGLHAPVRAVWPRTKAFI